MSAPNFAQNLWLVMVSPLYFGTNLLLAEAHVNS